LENPNEYSPMTIFELEGTKYVLRKRFSKDRIKDLEAFHKLISFYNADTIALDEPGNMVILGDRILEANILEEFI
jgi:hypothetical protein